MQAQVPGAGPPAGAAAGAVPPAGAAAGAAGAAAAVPPAVAPVPFALAPALVTHDVINYATREGQNLYNRGIAPLDDDNRFDGTATNLRHFLSLVHTRAHMMGWDSILRIPDDVATPLGPSKYLPVHYGEIPMAHVQAHVTANIVGQQSRAAQDSAMLYNCLVNSLTPAAWSRMSLHEKDFTIQDTPEGVSLLRVIIRESHLDTNATASQIRTALTQLDTAMGTYGHDIQKFNEYVQTLVQRLAARGQTSDDLLVNLFKGYKACTDNKFQAYIELKESEYEEGAELTATMLMQLALNKYQARLEKKEWNAPSPEQQKILALEVELKKMRAAKPKQPGQNEKGKKKKKGGNNKKKKADQFEKPAWMRKPPTAAEKAKGSKKTVDKKLYHWCPKHAAWVRHTPEQCKLPEKQEGDDKSNAHPATANETPANKRTLKLSDAVAALVNQE